jgi:hypothetical protein
MINCVYCDTDTCSVDCASTCPIEPIYLGPGACDVGDCNDCLDTNCSQDACTTEYNACMSSQDCIDFNTCFGGCSDVPCVQACQAQYPAGATLWYAFYNCWYCSPSSCQGDCSYMCPIEPY